MSFWPTVTIGALTLLNKLYFFKFRKKHFFFSLKGMKNLGITYLWSVLLLLMWFESNVTGADGNHPRKEDVPHSRQKRLLWITTDGRLALPPGTHLTITPSLSLPFVRYPPDGFLSNMSISLPFTSKCVQTLPPRSFTLWSMCCADPGMWHTSRTIYTRWI